jgi:hypothetical protein
MLETIDDRLNALAKLDLPASLDGLEDRVWIAVQQRRADAGAGSMSVRVALTVAALAVGLAFGALHTSVKPDHLSEMGVLSEDGLLAPSIRLGGGA